MLERDPNGDENNEYHIRSLYFDTIYNDALLDKLDGVKNRDKYRIRIYNFSDKFIRMECKTKVGSLISKRSVAIPKLLAEQIIAGDPTGLEQSRSGLLRDVYREMKINYLHPVVIVDYVREAYLHPAEEVRITFDKQLHSGLHSIDIFNPYVPTLSPFDHDEMIRWRSNSTGFSPIISATCFVPVFTAPRTAPFPNTYGAADSRITNKSAQ
ncbi:MAG: polyphosphate polymerase domain-containing protein [Lachnospiraceae bacterium]